MLYNFYKDIKSNCCYSYRIGPKQINQLGLSTGQWLYWRDPNCWLCNSHGDSQWIPWTRPGPTPKILVRLFLHAFNSGIYINTQIKRKKNFFFKYTELLLYCLDWAQTCSPPASASYIVATVGVCHHTRGSVSKISMSQATVHWRNSGKQWMWFLGPSLVCFLLSHAWLILGHKASSAVLISVWAASEFI